MSNTSDVRIRSVRPLITPAILEDELPLPDSSASFVQQARRAVGDIVMGLDDRALELDMRALIEQLDEFSLSQHLKSLAEQFDDANLSSKDAAELLWQAKIAGHSSDYLEQLLAAISQLDQQTLLAAAQRLINAEGGWLCLASDSMPGAPWQAAK